MRAYIIEWYNKEEKLKKTLVIDGNKSKAESLFLLTHKERIDIGSTQGIKHIPLDRELIIDL